MVTIGCNPMSVSWMGSNYLLFASPTCSSYLLHTLVQPVLTIVWGVLLLGEDASFQQKIGMGLILLAVISVTVMGAVEAETE